MKLKYLILSILTMFTIIFNSCGKKSNAEPEEKKEETAGNSISLHDKTFAGASGNGFSGALQSDGKIIAIGSFGGKSSLYRFNKDGGIDNTFNIDLDKSWIINGLSAVAILSDGKILVGGDFTIGGTRKILLKLNANGALDNSFPSPNFNSVGSKLPTIKKIIDLGSDRVLVAGEFNMFTASPRIDFNSLVKITYTGLLDISYQTNLLATSYPNDILPLNDGKLLVSGTLKWSNGQTSKPFIARLNANGSQDLTFHFKERLTGLFVGTGYTDGSITAMQLQSNGKIIIAGGFSGIEDNSIRDGSYGYSQLARLNTDGTVDKSFKSPKSYTTDIRDIAVLPDNRILAGRYTSLNVGIGESYLRLYDSEGVVDEKFNLGYPNSGVSQILKQSDGKYLLIGSFKDSSDQAILRVSVK